MGTGALAKSPPTSPNPPPPEDPGKAHALDPYRADLARRRESDNLSGSNSQLMFGCLGTDSMCQPSEQGGHRMHNKPFNTPDRQAKAQMLRGHATRKLQHWLLKDVQLL